MLTSKIVLGIIIGRSVMEMKKMVRYFQFILFLFLLSSCATPPASQIQAPPPQPARKAEIEQVKEKTDPAEEKREKIKKLARDIIIRLEALNRDIYGEKITLVIWYPYDEGTKTISPCGKSFYRDLYAYIASQFDPRYIRIVDREDFEKTLEEIDFQKQIHFDKNTVVEIGKKLGATVGLIGRVRYYPEGIEFFPKFLDIATSDVLPSVDPEVIPLDYDLKKHCKEIDLRVQFRAYRYNVETQRRTLLRPGDSLKEGDRIKLELTPNHRSYLYLINVDSNDRFFTLFPNPQIPIENPVERFQSLLLPGRRHSFLVDNTEGTELIYAFASLNRDEELETLIGKMSTENNLSTTKNFNRLLKKRGLNDIVEDPSFSPQGDYYDILEKKVDESRAAKRYIFPHR